jgi:hypothetical protein
LFSDAVALPVAAEAAAEDIALDLWGENDNVSLLLYDARICDCDWDRNGIVDAFNWLISIYDIADLGLCIFMVSSSAIGGATATAAMSSVILIYRIYDIVFMLFHSKAYSFAYYTRTHDGRTLTPNVETRRDDMGPTLLVLFNVRSGELPGSRQRRHA